MRVVWTKAHAALEEKATMTLNIGRWHGTVRRRMGQPTPEPFKVVRRWLNELRTKPLTRLQKVDEAIRYAATFHDEVDGGAR